MHTGMLWFDNSQTALTVKIQKAADYYRAKYGRTPDLVLVHPSMMQETRVVEFDYLPSVVKDEHDKFSPQQKASKIMIRPYRPVLPGHIWVGIEDKN